MQIFRPEQVGLGYRAVSAVGATNFVDPNSLLWNVITYFPPHLSIKEFYQLIGDGSFETHL
jgi:hypothetical protein